MPLPEFFAQIPPFPDDVETCDLPEISLAALESGDVKQSQELFDACCELGFFRINLQDSELGESLLGDTGEVFRASKATHDLTGSELQKFLFNPPRSLYGYKGVGFQKNEDGRPDNFSFYCVGRDDILGVLPARNNPDTIEDKRPTFQSFFTQAHSVMKIVFQQLDSHLRLPEGTIADLHRLDRPSGTSARLLKATADSEDRRTNILGHTDLGSITLLFNVVGGLQILLPGRDNSEENWRYVKPKPGCAIINIADALVEWSGGILRSNMHRVVTPPSSQMNCDRYSVAYAVRPDGDASMKPLRSKAIPVVDEADQEQLSARDWEAMRAVGILKGQNLARSLGGTAKLITTDEPIQIASH